MVDEAAACGGQGPVNFLSRKFGGARAPRAAAEIKKQKPRAGPGAFNNMESVAQEIKNYKPGSIQAKSAPTKKDVAAEKKAGEKKSWIIPVSKKKLFNDLGELSFSGKLVRLTMELYADGNGELFTAIRTMAKDLHCSPGLVARAIKELIEKKNVRIIGKHGRANLYSLEEFKKF